jgi:hypothetical protein
VSAGGNGFVLEHEGRVESKYGISFSLSPVDASGDIIRWTNPAGGSFGTTSNWQPQRVPEKTDSRSDIALFDLNEVYTVSVNGSRTVEQLVVRHGRVQFTGDTLTAGATSVPSVSVEGDGRLNVLDGQLRSFAAVIGNAASPDFATWLVPNSGCHAILPVT